jgi:hypothetical protein
MGRVHGPVAAQRERRDFTIVARRFLMNIHTRPNAAFTASLAFLLAFTFCNAALAKPRKLKTPSSEMGIKRDLDGAPKIRVDHRAKHIARQPKKR